MKNLYNKKIVIISSIAAVIIILSILTTNHLNKHRELEAHFQFGFYHDMYSALGTLSELENDMNAWISKGEILVNDESRRHFLFLQQSIFSAYETFNNRIRTYQKIYEDGSLEGYRFVLSDVIREIKWDIYQISSENRDTFVIELSSEQLKDLQHNFMVIKAINTVIKRYYPDPRHISGRYSDPIDFIKSPWIEMLHEIDLLLTEIYPDLVPLANSLLYNAAMNGDKEVVKVLIDEGIDVNVDLFGETAVTIAKENGHNEIVDLLK